MFFWGIVCKTKRKTTSPAGPRVLAPPSGWQGLHPAGGPGGGGKMRAWEAGLLQPQLASERFAQRKPRGKSFLPLSFPPAHGGFHLVAEPC